MGTITEAFLHDIPKTDLHVHLDGSMRIETLIELANERNIPLPSTDPHKLKEILNIGGIHENLESYLRVFDTTLLVLQDEEALTRTAFELAEDAALENCRYIEVRYSPVLHQRNGLSLPVIVESVAAGLRMAKKKYGILSGQIICAMRHLPPQSSLRLAELAVAFKNKGVVGFDLAGGEVNNPAEKHAEAFAYVRKNNLNSTIHAGEAYGTRSIHQAIHACNAHRIGHGTRLRENGDLLNYINDHRIPLEVCLKSNVQTAAVDAIENHPLKFYMDFGLRVTLNTDNRLVTDTTITDEYKLACQVFHLTYDEVKRLVVDGFKSAFMPFRKKREVMRMVLDEFEEVSRKHGLKSEVAATAMSRYAIDRAGEDPMPD